MEIVSFDSNVNIEKMTSNVSFDEFFREISLNDGMIHFDYKRGISPDKIQERERNAIERINSIISELNCRHYSVIRRNYEVLDRGVRYISDSDDNEEAYPSSVDWIFSGCRKAAYWLLEDSKFDIFGMRSYIDCNNQRYKITGSILFNNAGNVQKGFDIVAGEGFPIKPSRLEHLAANAFCRHRDLNSVSPEYWEKLNHIFRSEPIYFTFKNFRYEIVSFSDIITLYYLSKALKCKIAHRTIEKFRLANKTFVYCECANGFINKNCLPVNPRELVRLKDENKLCLVCGTMMYMEKNNNSRQLKGNCFSDCKKHECYE